MKFCSNCGDKFVDQLAPVIPLPLSEGGGLRHPPLAANVWPRSCAKCGTIFYQNPIPVTVLLQPVVEIDTGARGILIGRRNIEPAIGEWALISGFIEGHHTAEETGVKELHEETGFSAQVANVTPFMTRNTGRQLLIFCDIDSDLIDAELNNFVVNEECTEVRVAWKPETLAFSFHTEALKMWFDRQ